MKKKINFINLFCVSYLGLSIFVLIFAALRFFKNFHGKGDFYFKLFIISMIITFLWFLVLFLKKKFKEIIIVTATSILFALYSAEIFININSFSKNKNISDSKFKKFKELKSENVSIAYSGLIENEPFFTMGGVSNTKTILCNETGKWSMYKSDRYGFNNPDKEWEKPSSGYLIIGGSFAHGGCVDEGQDLTSHIRNLSGEKAINLGFIGNGPIKNLATLREYINFIKPKKVFWLHYEGNALYNLKKEMNNKFLSKYLETEYSQNLITKQNDIDFGLIKKSIEYEKIYEEWHGHSTMKFNKSKLIEILKISEVRNILGLSAFWQVKLDGNFEKTIQKAKKQAELINADFYFVYLPSFVRINQFFPKDNLFDKENLIKILNKINIKTIDLDKEFFKKAEDPLNYFNNRKYGHYTAEAYKKIAKKLLLIRD
jgi:hypothetical protein|tara:strand:- start:2040 stop:3326 length:1287 start_codon:yes stop_codon:yes gene_type:complete